MSGADAIVIIGGGATGVILAAQLLRSSNPSLRVTVIEKRDAFGHGIAYSTTLQSHLLNVDALGMSALADDPDHFARWLRANDVPGAETRPSYAPRSVYGRYLADLAGEISRQEPVRLRLLTAEVEQAVPTGSGVEVRLANGASIAGRVAVLAVGHDEEPVPELGYTVRIGSQADTPIDPDGRVLILGTGLSMVDAWLTLDQRGHRGEIVALSRRGLLPSAHRQGKPIRLDSADIPLGTELSYFVDWFRNLVRSTQKAGGNWRDVVDGIRPFNRSIWQNWPVSAKRRFLEHTKAWWDIHRHRMAPEIHAQVDGGVRAGRLKLLAGRVLDVEQHDGSLDVAIQPRHERETKTLSVVRVYDCTGIVRDVATSSNPAIRSLIQRGQACPDPLHLGLHVSTACAVVDAAGNASDRLFAVGPLTRGTFFEIDAVPEIRVQCARLAARLAP